MSVCTLLICFESMSMQIRRAISFIPFSSAPFWVLKFNGQNNNGGLFCLLWTWTLVAYEIIQHFGGRWIIHASKICHTVERNTLVSIELNVNLINFECSLCRCCCAYAICIRLLKIRDENLIIRCNDENQIQRRVHILLCQPVTNVLNTWMRIVLGIVEYFPWIFIEISHFVLRWTIGIIANQRLMNTVCLIGMSALPSRAIM